MRKFLCTAICLAFAVVLCAASASAQQMFFRYNYEFEPAMITEPPEIGGLEFEYPEAARKNGVEGTVKVSLTLGEDGKVRDVRVHNDLGHGTSEAISAGLQRFAFKPARYNGTPAALKMTVSYIITLVYDEDDKGVTKPKIVDKPMPPYPQKHLAEGIKGKVLVRVLFRADGTVEVVGVNSDMHREFDTAASEAAKKLKFSPAVHKRSKQPVSQVMSVEYTFKP